MMLNFAIIFVGYLMNKEIRDNNLNMPIGIIYLVIFTIILIIFKPKE